MVGRGGGICSKNHSGRQNELNIYLGEKEKLSQRHFPNIYIYGPTWAYYSANIMRTASCFRQGYCWSTVTLLTSHAKAFSPMSVAQLHWQHQNHRIKNGPWLQGAEPPAPAVWLWAKLSILFCPAHSSACTNSLQQAQPSVTFTLLKECGFKYFYLRRFTQSTTS